ncbi:MarR family transcriptional regulator [Litorilituus lipolyticus]|uniref:MarR family transcriptional regulator n=1 Tax=Litorilituus lipolyticus TaxID=2491017 RepID=A0A502KVI6_9GAMM|nr:MarR family transcriptional regulator [Litorilituus lipolyticus]
MISNYTREQAFKLSTQTIKPLDLTTHLPFRVAVVSNLLALNRDWEIRELCDLEPREIRVLLNIGSYMPIKAADIAYQSRIDSYNVSRAVKALSSKELINIVPDSYSKNIKYLTLNEKGQELYQQISSAISHRATELESVLTHEELKSFYSILEKIEDKSEQLLAQQAIKKIDKGHTPPADQKELIRWYRKRNG